MKTRRFTEARNGVEGVQNFNVIGWNKRQRADDPGQSLNNLHVLIFPCYALHDPEGECSAPLALITMTLMQSFFFRIIHTLPPSGMWGQQAKKLSMAREYCHEIGWARRTTAMWNSFHPDHSFFNTITSTVSHFYDAMHSRSRHSTHPRKFTAHEFESECSTLAGSIDDNTPQWDGDTQHLYGIAHGSAGMVWAIDEYTVAKVYLGRNSRSIGNSATERQAYRNLINSGLASDHFLKCYDVNNKYGLLLERCRETVRQRVRSAAYSAQSQALPLAIQAAQALEVIHSCGIIQGDVGCHNMLIGNDDKLKIADFAGSVVVGAEYPSSVDYEVGSKLPGCGEPTERSDVFALGSAIYEMITGRQLYNELHYTEIQRRLKNEEFPNDFGQCYRLGSIVEKCWGKKGKSFHTAAQVLEALYELDPSSRVPHVSQRAPKKVYQRPRTATCQTTPLEQPRKQTRRSHSENAKYVSSHRSEKRSEKSRGSPRSQRYDILVGNNERTKHRTNEHGTIHSIVHTLQALKLSVHPSSLSGKKRDHDL